MYKYNIEFVPKDSTILRSIIFNPNFDGELTIKVIDIETSNIEIISLYTYKTPHGINFLSFLESMDFYFKWALANLFYNYILGGALYGNPECLAYIIDNLCILRPKIEYNFIISRTETIPFYMPHILTTRAIINDFDHNVRIFAYSPYCSSVSNVVITRYNDKPTLMHLYAKKNKVFDSISGEQIGFIQSSSTAEFKLYALILTGRPKIVELNDKVSI